MHLSDLVSGIAKRTGFTQADVNATLGAFAEELKEAAAKGERVQFTGLFTMEPVTRAARMGKNPRTKETIEIPAQKTVKFSVGAKLKAAAKSAK